MHKIQTHHSIWFTKRWPFFAFQNTIISGTTFFLVLNYSEGIIIYSFTTWAGLTKIQSKILEKNHQNKFSHHCFLNSLNCPQVLKVKIARIKYVDKMKTGYEPEFMNKKFGCAWIRWATLRPCKGLYYTSYFRENNFKKQLDTGEFISAFQRSHEVILVENSALKSPNYFL